MIREMILKNRSFRRFDQNVKLDEQLLRELVDLGRISGSAANLQPLRYVLSWTDQRNALIFEHVAWAGYLQDWDGPAEGERPSGYVIVLADNRVSKNVDCDHGIACQSILLGAIEKGLGGCMIGSIRREALQQVLGIGPEYKILLIVALGKPAEQVELEDVGPEGDIKYWRDEASIHHVPKRTLDEIILKV